MIHNNNRHSNAPCGCQYYKRANTLLNVMIATISTTKYNYYHPNTCIRKEILNETILRFLMDFCDLPIRYGSSTKSSSCIFCVYHTHISSWIVLNTLIDTWIHHSRTLSTRHKYHTIHPLKKTLHIRIQCNNSNEVEETKSLIKTLNQREQQREDERSETS